MNTSTLKINKNLLDYFAQERFNTMSGDESLWDNVYKNIGDKIKPQCIYQIYEGVETIGDTMKVGDVTITADVFSTMPEEILGNMAIFACTIGTLPEMDSVLDNTLVDIAGTAYMDAVRALLRSELEEEEDYIISGTLGPGLDGMDLKEIMNFAKLIDLEEVGITINDHYVMAPDKSAIGMIMFFNEEHPANHNNCATCMTRGYGCTFCSSGSKDNSKE